MPYPTSPEFKKHSANAAAVKHALVHVERMHRAEIRRAGKAALSDEGDAQIEAFQRMHHLLIGVLAESTLRKIITDPTGGFDTLDREALWRLNQPQRWLGVVDLAFRRHFSVPKGTVLNETSLEKTTAERYAVVTSLLKNDLHQVITDRNRTAHGQWAFHLKSGEDNIFKVAPAPAPPNYIVSRAQATLIEAIARLVYVLVVSEPTFDRDYDETILKIEGARGDLSGNDYQKYVVSLSPKKFR